MNRNKLLALTAVLFTASLILSGDRAYATYGGMGTFSIDESPADIVPYPSHQANRDFTIGLRGPGYCNILRVLAPSQADALYYAQRYCPSCYVEDLTGEYVRGKSPLESRAPFLSQEFCAPY